MVKEREYGTLYNDDKNSSRKLYTSFDLFFSRCIYIQEENPNPFFSKAKKK